MQLIYLYILFIKIFCYTNFLFITRYPYNSSVSGGCKKKSLFLNFSDFIRIVLEPIL